MSLVFFGAGFLFTAVNAVLVISLDAYVFLDDSLSDPFPDCNQVWLHVSMG